MLCYERLKLWGVTLAATRDVAIGVGVIDDDGDMDKVTSILGVSEVGELRRVIIGFSDSEKNTNSDVGNLGVAIELEEPDKH